MACLEVTGGKKEAVADADANMHKITRKLFTLSMLAPIYLKR